MTMNLDPLLEKYVAQSRIMGVGDDVLRKDLINKGFSETEVSRALREMPQSAEPAVKHEPDIKELKVFGSKPEQPTVVIKKSHAGTVWFSIAVLLAAFCAYVWLFNHPLYFAVLSYVHNAILPFLMNLSAKLGELIYNVIQKF